MRCIRSRRRAIAKVSEITYLAATGLENLIIDSRISGPRFWITPSPNRDLESPQFQMTRHDQAVARVVAFATANDNWPANSRLAHHVDDAPPGIFHQHDARDMEFRDGPFVQPPHL